MYKRKLSLSGKWIVILVEWNLRILEFIIYKKGIFFYVLDKRYCSYFVIRCGLSFEYKIIKRKFRFI